MEEKPGKRLIEKEFVEIIKKAMSETRHNNKFDWTKFKKSLLMWLFGGILALLPIALTFLFKPIEELSVWQFFSDIELIYVCVTMSIISLCDIVINRINTLFWGNFLAVVIGTVIYASLKSGAAMPIFEFSNNLSVFNIGFLLYVLIIGILGYINISFIGG